MEIRVKPENYLDLDSEGDMVGVVVDRPVICGFCMTQMEQVGKHLFRCPRCGTTYESIVA